MIIENEGQLSVLREGGKRLAHAMDEVAKMVVPGVNTQQLEDKARDMLSRDGDTPAFLGYTPEGADRPYPAALCTSINEQVVHGIPNEEPYTFKEGDVVTLDMGLIHKGLVTDMARTVVVGTAREETNKLAAVAEEALTAALIVARAGNTTGDIGHAVETVAAHYGFSVPRELGGHGVGNSVHEEPFIPNFGTPGTGTLLEKNMVLAIEPIIIAGHGAIALAPDGYTYVTRDHSWSTQFEHTVVITDGAPEILTQ